MDQDAVLASEQMTAQQLKARLEAQGVSSSITVIREATTGEVVEGVSINPHDLLAAFTGTTSAHHLPPELEALLQAAVARTLPKGPLSVEGSYLPDLSAGVLAWCGSYLLSTYTERVTFLHMLWAAYRAWRKEAAN